MWTDPYENFSTNYFMKGKKLLLSRVEKSPLFSPLHSNNTAVAQAGAAIKTVMSYQQLGVAKKFMMI